MEYESSVHETIAEELMHLQNKPIIHKGPIMQELVQKDFDSRLAIGIERYGTGLQAFNGRDMLRDAYEEALDLCVYLRGAIYERDGK